MSTDAPAVPAMPVERDDKMPSSIPFIVSNEFAERFCFYGINSILALYMVQYLHFTDAKAASWQSLFKSGAYFFPMIGAVVSDVFWGKFRTIMVFSIFYVAGCIGLALVGDTPLALAISLGMVALGTGGIKPCVSTNVGDQFTAKNAHLIEKAFSWFYWSINLGSSISIFFCPVLLKDPNYGPKWAFGMPAAMMMVAALIFFLGRMKYAHVPPAGRAWVEEVKNNWKLVLNLLVLYLFVIFFWMLWDQSNGNTWTLQANSSLMDKNLGFGITLLPAQLQVVNGLFILVMAPAFSYFVYPMIAKFTPVTPLRKIGVGLFTVASSFVIVMWVEDRIQNGHSVSAWWQILAYVVLTASEILVSITALEFSYKQAPLRMKSFIMGLFLLTTSLGNFGIAAVNNAMVRPLHATAIESGDETWVTLDSTQGFVLGQKLDLTGEVGLQLVKPDGKTEALQGTFLIAAIEGQKLKLMDVEQRKPIKSTGTMGAKAEVSTYWLVGPMYFLFFIGLMCAMGVVFVFVSMRYQEQTHVRT